MSWPSYDLSALDGPEANLPALSRLRSGAAQLSEGLGRSLSCFPRNPFMAHVDHDPWETAGGESLSLREIAGRMTKQFWPSIRRYADPFTLRLIGNVMAGRAPSLLELADRPPSLRERRPPLRLGGLALSRDAASPLALRACAHSRDSGDRLRIGGTSGTRRRACAAGRTSCSAASAIGPSGSSRSTTSSATSTTGKPVAVRQRLGAGLFLPEMVPVRERLRFLFRRDREAAAWRAAPPERSATRRACRAPSSPAGERSARRRSPVVLRIDIMPSSLPLSIAHGIASSILCAARKS